MSKTGPKKSDKLLQTKTPANFFLGESRNKKGSKYSLTEVICMD